VYKWFWWRNQREGNPLEDPGLDGSKKVRWIFRKGDVGGGGHGLDCSGSGYGQVAGTCEYGNEPSASIKCWEFLD